MTKQQRKVAREAVRLNELVDCENVKCYTRSSAIAVIADRIVV